MFLVRKNIAASTALIFLLMSTASFAQSGEAKPATQPRGDPVAGREKSQLCQGCHGEYGDSFEEGLVPKLSGQHRQFIAKQIRDYQAGTRSHQIMNAMAATVSEEDIADIAAYYASQPKMKGNGSGDNLVGKRLFLHGDTSRIRFGCVNCHGVNGKGMGYKVPMFPVIGGQQKNYLRKMLTEYRDGIVTNSPRSIMNIVARTLSDAEIDALAEYLAGK